MKNKNYYRFKFKYKETAATILVKRKEDYDVVASAILEARKEIEEFIKKDPFFLVTLEPYNCSGKVVGRMCRASKLAKVGPMAAVAGTIAQYAVERAIEDGIEFVVVDNGGDISMYVNKELKVGIYTPSKVTQFIGFKIKPSDTTLAICTSSGTVGHSISFGFADAATVFAKDASIADAFATSLGNRIKDNLTNSTLKKILHTFWNESKYYIDGAMVIKDNLIGMVGNIPEIIKAEIQFDLITRY